jgi:putative ABC transport system ATP-binding protein
VSAARGDREALIDCREISVVHGEGETAVQALRGVALQVRQGEYLGVLGRSGSGKTTLLHVIGGLIGPTSGSVCWHGEPLPTLDQTARGGDPARAIAYVFQGANLLPSLDASENIAFAIRAARGRGGTTPRRCATGELESPADFLALVGLGRKAGSLASELSGGEQQRVALARALAQRPQLLLCDEPTGHLDSDTGRRVLDLIDALRELFGFTVVVATHDPEVGARADRTVSLDDGRILTGSPV